MEEVPLLRRHRRRRVRIDRGDAFLHNSPYHGNSHAADHCLLVPVLDEAGKLRFWVFTKAHQADCGNSKPTTYVGDAKDVYFHNVGLFVGSELIRIKAAFCDELSVAGVLGRTGFFDNFIVTFNQADVPFVEVQRIRIQ